MTRTYTRLLYFPTVVWWSNDGAEYRFEYKARSVVREPDGSLTVTKADGVVECFASGVWVRYVTDRPVTEVVQA